MGILPHVTLQTTLGDIHYYNLHFTGKETEAWRESGTAI